MGDFYYWQCQDYDAGEEHYSGVGSLSHNLTDLLTSLKSEGSDLAFKRLIEQAWLKAG